MAKVKTTRFDVAETLETPQAEYVPAALEAAGVRARCCRRRHPRHGRHRACGRRENLTKALGETGNPEFATMLGDLQALGLELTVRPVKGKTPRQRARKVA